MSETRVIYWMVSPVVRFLAKLPSHKYTKSEWIAVCVCVRVCVVGLRNKLPKVAAKFWPEKRETFYKFQIGVR